MKRQYNNCMQPDFGKLRSPQPLMRSVMWQIIRAMDFAALVNVVLCSGLFNARENGIV